jgi:hypothetical protein
MSLSSQLHDLPIYPREIIPQVPKEYVAGWVPVAALWSTEEFLHLLGCQSSSLAIVANDIPAPALEAAQRWFLSPLYFNYLSQYINQVCKKQQFVTRVTKILIQSE